MSRPPATYNLHEAAHRDAQEAVDYYEDIREELGDRFEQAYNATLDRIVEAPDIGRPYMEGAKRIRMQKPFPYYLVYLDDEEENHLTFLAVAHEKQDEGYWIERL